MKNKKPKSLGEIAYEKFGGDNYKVLSSSGRKFWDGIAKAVERAVISRLKREGKLK